MNQLMAPGQTTFRQFGPLHIRIDRHDEGVSINVTHHPILDRTFTNLDEGRAYLTLLRDEATAGTAVWAIEEQAGAWTSAAAVVDQVEEAMIAGIRANMDAATPPRVDVSDIVSDIPAGGSWAALRRSTTRKAAITSEPMDRVLASAIAGYVPRSGRATSRQLIALSDRGLVELDWQWIGRERVIVGAWLAGHKPSEVAA